MLDICLNIMDLKKKKIEFCNKVIGKSVGRGNNNFGEKRG
jgi:hypothetical protein